jgi:hypothetical protein
VSRIAWWYLCPVQSLHVKTDFDLQGDGLVWYARHQLFFNCTLFPTGAKGLSDCESHCKHECMSYSDSPKKVSLVYFSTFEPIELTPDSIMQQAGVPMLYDSASNPHLPCLYNESTSAPWPTYLGAPPSFHASSAATVTRQFYTASGTIRILEMPLPTHSATGATVAGSTR